MKPLYPEIPEEFNPNQGEKEVHLLTGQCLETVLTADALYQLALSTHNPTQRKILTQMANQLEQSAFTQFSQITGPSTHL